MELALDPATGDLQLTAGNLVFTTDLQAEVYQRLLVRFNFWRTEWFMDLRQGVPWSEAIFDKGVPDRVIQSVLGQVVTGCVGVAALDSLSFVRDDVDRLLTVEIVARLEDGATFRSLDFPPIVIAI